MVHLGLMFFCRPEAVMKHLFMLKGGVGLCVQVVIMFPVPALVWLVFIVTHHFGKSLNLHMGTQASCY